MAKETASSSSEPENNDELEQITIARALLNYRLKEKMAMSDPNAPIPFQKKFQIQSPRPTSTQPPPPKTSKILPLICQKAAPRSRPSLVTANDSVRSKPSFATANDNPRSKYPPAAATSDRSGVPPQSSALESRVFRPLKFPAAGAAPYVPLRQMRSPCHGVAPPVTVRNMVPVFSAPPLPPPPTVHQVIRAPPVRVAPPVNIRQAIPVYAAPPVPARKDEPSLIQKDLSTISIPCQQDILPHKIQESGKAENSLPVNFRQAIPVYAAPPTRIDEPSLIQKEELPTISTPGQQDKLPPRVQETENSPSESETVRNLEQLKI